MLFTLRGGWGATLAWRNQHLRFEPGQYAFHKEDSAGTVPFAVPHGLYNLWGANLGLNTPNRALSGSVGFGYNAQPVFDEASRGRGFSTFVGGTWRPTDALRIDAQWVHSRLTRAADDSRFSIANIPRLKIEYQLSRSVFFRYVGQYVSQERAALRSPTTGGPVFVNDRLAGAFAVNDFRSDLLFSYRPTPGTVLFLGYGSSLTEDTSFRFSDLRRTADGVFIKASYLFRL